MRILATVVAAAGAALAAGQQLRFFWAETGLTANQDLMSAYNFLPDWDSTPVVPVTEIPNDQPVGNKRVYLWVEFLNHPNIIPFQTKLLGMTIDLTGSASYSAGVLYRHTKTSGAPPVQWTRWDGDTPITLDNALCIAVEQDGIVCWDTDDYMPGTDLYDLGTGRRFLLGSVVVGDVGDGATLTAAAGSLGIVCVNGGGPAFPVQVTPATVTFVGDPGPVLGACCSPGSGCVYETELNCLVSYIGTWLGPQTSCASCTGCKGDVNCDVVVDFFDIDYFVEALSYPGGVGWPHLCPWNSADADQDGDVDFFDIDAFVARIGASCL